MIHEIAIITKNLKPRDTRKEDRIQWFIHQVELLDLYAKYYEIFKKWRLLLVSRVDNTTPSSINTTVVAYLQSLEKDFGNHNLPLKNLDMKQIDLLEKIHTYLRYPEKLVGNPSNVMNIHIEYRAPGKLDQIRSYGRLTNGYGIRFSQTDNRYVLECNANTVSNLGDLPSIFAHADEVRVFTSETHLQPIDVVADDYIIVGSSLQTVDATFESATHLFVLSPELRLVKGRYNGKYIDYLLQ